MDLMPYTCWSSVQVRKALICFGLGDQFWERPIIDIVTHGLAQVAVGILCALARKTAIVVNHSQKEDQDALEKTSS